MKEKYVEEISWTKIKGYCLRHGLCLLTAADYVQPSLLPDFDQKHKRIRNFTMLAWLLVRQENQKLIFVFGEGKFSDSVWAIGVSHSHHLSFVSPAKLKKKKSEIKIVPVFLLGLRKLEHFLNRYLLLICIVLPSFSNGHSFEELKKLMQVISFLYLWLLHVLISVYVWNSLWNLQLLNMLSATSTP